LRCTGRRHDWDAGLSASRYVGLLMAGRIIDRVMPDDFSMSELFVIPFASILLPALPLPLLSAQHAAIRAEGDSLGASNGALTMADIAWIVLGALLWLLMLFGVYTSVAGMPV